MTEAEAIEAIQQRFIDGWTAIHPADPEDPDHVPFTFSGEVFDSSDTWVRLSVNHSTRNQMTAGATARFDSRGNIMVQLFGSIDIGATQLAELAEDVRTVLEGIRLQDIVIRAGASRPAGTDGRWEMKIVTLPFEVEQQRTPG